MRFKQIKPAHLQSNQRGKLRLCSPTQMTNAYTAARAGKFPIRKAAQQYGVPYQTLRDRVAGVIDPECVVMGRSPELNMEQEARLVSHLKEMAIIGYGYSRQEVVDLASNYAVHLQVRAAENPFSLRWFYSFMKRWPDLWVLKPCPLEFARAKAGSKVNIDKYFDELAMIINKYNLQDKPHLIFNVDEKGVTPEHRPPNVVGGTNFHPPAVTSGRSETVTILGCGSASGCSIPQYLHTSIFSGKKMQSKWMDGSSQGAVGTVSDSGWSNSQIFLDYLKHHFLSFVPGKYEKILLLLDGHKSHVSIPVIDWALDHNIILQILPAHTSHFLQPMDVGIYGPFQKIYNNLCHKKTRSTSTIVTKDDVCQLSCSAYLKSCTPENLQSSFKKTGIYPLNRDVIDSNIIAPSEVFIRDTEESNDIAECDHEGLCVTDNDNVERDVEDVECVSAGVTEEVVCDRDVREKESESVFFDSRIEGVKAVKSEKVTKKRNTLSKVVSGRAITESDVTEKVREHVSHQKGKGKKVVDSGSKSKRAKVELKSATEKTKSKGKGKGKSTMKETTPIAQPGPSHIYISEDSCIDTDEEIDKSELCCVCGKFTPE